MGYTPAVNSFTRVFIIERRARGDRAPVYHSNLVAGAVEQAFGDTEKIEVPDPNRYGSFQEAGQLRGGEERPTTSLTGRFAADLQSELLRLAKLRCDYDLHIHFGACDNPKDFSVFTKAIVLEGATIGNVATDELGTLESGGQAAVNETGDISASVWYEVMPLKFTERAGSIVSNEVVDIVLADAIGCGECADESDGCQKVYAVTLTAPGSPSTPSDLLYSPDGGVNWYATDVDGLGANDADAVSIIGSYIVVFSNAAGGHHYLAKADMVSFVNGSLGDPTFSATITTGYVGGGEPNDAWSVGNYAFIVGDGGYVYGSDDATAGVTVLDAGSATTSNLNAVHAISEEEALAGGASGAVIYTLDGTSWTAVTTAPTAQTINAVWMKTDREFWVGTADGRLYYTTDRGESWSEKTFTGSGAGAVHDIVFASDSVMYVSHATAAPAGRILRSYNGGYSFTVMPEGVGSIPANDRLTALTACPYNVNLVIGAGLGDNGTDGIIMRGAS